MLCCLGSRGAKVVVNDMNRGAASAVVAEIIAGGGEAVGNYDSVVQAEKSSKPLSTLGVR